jgi:hypothetical protein
MERIMTLENVCIFAVALIFVLSIADLLLFDKLRGLSRRAGHMDGYNKALRDMTERIGSCKKCEYYSNGLCVKNDIEPEETWFCADYKKLKEERNNEKR